MEEGLAVCDEVLCGSSWRSDMEWRAIKSGRQLGKKVTVFLNHWINYQERFIRNGVQHLPDEYGLGMRTQRSWQGVAFLTQ